MPPSSSSLVYELPIESPTPLYTQLADDGEIHLVHLQPGDVDDVVQFSIKHANLVDDPRYEALSYVWGDPDDASEALVEGSLFSTYEVRANLRSALFHLRHKNEERVIWIDALCINQRDTNERNHQVGQMGRIYSSATRVIAWLGESTASTSMAMMFISEFYKEKSRINHIYAAKMYRPDPKSKVGVQQQSVQCLTILYSHYGVTRIGKGYGLSKKYF